MGGAERLLEAEGAAPETAETRDALVESRQRFRELVDLASDLAFETDADGRFTFLIPGTVLGWPADRLLGQDSAMLLPQGLGELDPFRSARVLRRQQVWLCRPDGAMYWMSFSVTPMLDAAGTQTGVRGVARDITGLGERQMNMAQALRRWELIDHIVQQMQTEILAPRMMQNTLRALTGTLSATGAMVLDARPGDLPLNPDRDPALPEGMLHEVGGDRPALRALGLELLADGFGGASLLQGPDGEYCMLLATPTRFAGLPGVVVWRNGTQAFDRDDLSLLASCGGMLRVALEHGAIQGEMTRAARVDFLTGLSNRAAFHDMLEQHIGRLERDGRPGTLMFIDLDRFKSLNDRLGHEAGDQALRVTAELLRSATRPGDVVARLGGDEFAIWFDGMDELAAAERGERLRLQAPLALQNVGGGSVSLSFSIGIATRWPGGDADVDMLLRRADAAMYEAKRSGLGRWRVWREEGVCG